MTADELMTLAGPEYMGQAWLERDKLLTRINSRPPQCQHRTARRELRNLRDRMRYADRPYHYEKVWSDLDELSHEDVLRIF